MGGVNNNMRELKFRAWDTVLKKYATKEPFYFFGETTAFDLLGHYIAKTAKHRSTDSLLLNMNDLEIEQYTGLKDRNGVEIYEGDVLEYPEHTSRRDIFEVKKIDGGPCIPVFENDWNHYESLHNRQTKDFITNSCEVIGNIHQEEIKK